jgi:hypothetical protein
MMRYREPRRSDRHFLKCSGGMGYRCKGANLLRSDSTWKVDSKPLFKKPEPGRAG